MGIIEKITRIFKEDHTKAPIVEAIERYHKSGIVPFTTPGHKRDRGVTAEIKHALGAETYRNDITMQNGADDRRESKGIQQEAEKLFADAIGSEQSYFSTNGSSLSAHSAILTIANPGDKILTVRNMHKSMVAALIMADVIPVFLKPAIDEELDVEHGVTPEHLEEMLDAHPEVKGVFIVSPDYYGVTSDVAALADLCHDQGIPLVVDEAWGPHFPFHSDLPPSAMECGADISFGSVHKTMNGLSQASVLNVQGKLIDQDRFTLCFDLFETTSPSSLIMASTDAARRQMALNGEKIWEKTRKLARKARKKLANLEGLHVVGEEVLEKPGTYAFDETKLTVDVRGLGLSGYLAADWMLENFNITVELIDHRHVMAIISPADTHKTVDRLIAALKGLWEWAEETKPNAVAPLPHHRELGTELVMSPTKAFFSKTRNVPIEEAAGEIIAEMVSPYPPGIPRLLPGERITTTILDYLQKGRDAGMFVLDPSDQTLQTLRVVA